MTRGYRTRAYGNVNAETGKLASMQAKVEKSAKQDNKLMEKKSKPRTTRPANWKLVLVVKYGTESLAIKKLL